MRKPFPAFNPFRSFVEKELGRRKSSIGEISSPFVRMTSCMESGTPYNYIFFSLGLHGYANKDVNLFDVSYTKRDIVGYAVDKSTGKKKLIASNELTQAPLPDTLKQSLSKEQLDQIQKQSDKRVQDTLSINAYGSHPIPGITRVSTQRQGLGAPLTVEVEWICYNRAQLEFLRNHFMIAGRYVVVEWGSQYNTKPLKKIIDFTKVEDTTKLLADVIIKGRRVVLDEWTNANDGNYDFIVGMTGNYSVQVDAVSGVYTCKSTFYTMGENMYGYNMYNTIVRGNNTNDFEVNASSFEQFFKYGYTFDRLISSATNTDNKGVFTGTVNSAHESVIIDGARWNKDVDNKAEHLKDLKKDASDPNDYAFISWGFFADTVIPEMFTLFDDPNLKKDVGRFMNLTEGTNKFTSGSVAPTTTVPTTEDLEITDWVGSNQFLRSTDPSSMVLITQDLSASVPKPFSTGGFFDGFPDSLNKRGKLTQGVWLNADMVREAFLTSQTFKEGLSKVLNNMNHAVGGYWGLQLFYDEENNVYKVIDVKYSAYIKPEESKQFYVFNNGTDGECLNINMESAFPPELITQLGMYAKYKTETKENQLDLLKAYPTLGTTSTFIFSLNWTTLNDVVGQRVNAELQNTSKSKPSDTVLAVVGGPTDHSHDSLAFRTNGFGLSNVTAMSRDNLTNPSASLATTINTKDPVVFISRNKLESGRSLINNNPGNIKFTQEQASKYGAVLEDPDGNGVRQFAKYPTAAGGFTALVALIDKYKRQTNPSLTVEGTLEKYAPVSDPAINYTNARDHDVRLKELCLYMRCTPNTLLRELDSFSFARIIAKQESQTQLLNLPKLSDNLHNTRANGVIPPPIKSLDSDTHEMTPGDEERAKQINDSINDIKQKFGSQFLSVINPSAPQMIQSITKDGVLKYPIANSFVAPFPTTSNVSVTIQGISGISVSDGFYVRKLPFVFEQYGCFQVTSINDNIDVNGWRTNINGYFKLLYLKP